MYLQSLQICPVSSRQFSAGLVLARLPCLFKTVFCMSCLTSRPRKDHFKNDLRSDQDHLLKNDFRSDQDHIFSKKWSWSKIKIIDHFLPQKSSFLRVKISCVFSISILMLENPPKCRNHTRNPVKLTYLKNTQNINCLKRPKFVKKMIWSN
jgi:hypothetical protein